MNKLLLFLFSITLICCSNKQVKTDNFNFKVLIEKDILDLVKLLTDLDTITNESDWVQGDKQFYKYWLEAAKCEQNGDFKAAINHYKDALDVARYEMSTYEIKLPLGRAYIQNGNISKAKTIINEFKKDAEHDINNEDVEWGLSEEGKEHVRKEIKLADEFLSSIKILN